MSRILGGIYGIFKENNLFFIFISFVILVLMFVIVYKNYRRDKVKFALWQLILAGGISNIIDRIFRGYVVDFIQMKPFGIFNISDALIVVGVSIFIYLEMKELKSGDNKESSNRK